MRGLLEKDIRLLMHSKQTFVCFIASAVVKWSTVYSSV